jgi:hypothetical protein
MRFSEILAESKNHPVIVVDVQPVYCTAKTETVCHGVIQFVQKQTGPVLMFVNAEQDGLTDDTIVDIQTWWNQGGVDSLEFSDEMWDDDYDEQSPQTNQINININWKRVTIVDKGYGWFRAYMDQGVPESTIIKMIRHLYQRKLHDARDLEDEEYVAIMGSDQLKDEAFSVNWTSVAQLKRFSGAYIVGGGRNECLREVELLMNAFNIKYKRIDSLVY